jgi:hypothetical protein
LIFISVIMSHNGDHQHSKANRLSRNEEHIL